MKDNAADDTLIDRLSLALDSESMPKAARDYAQHLLNRLSQPVRVSILGNPKSGKTELVNMFLGESLVTADASIPTTEFVWGEKHKMTLTMADGAVETFEDLDFGKLQTEGAAFLRLEAPVDILRRISVLEVVTNGAAEELESAVDWAVRRTDIALWCTQEFGPAEQEIWSRVPDSLKDHAFLVLTKADRLSAEKVLSSRVADLESIVAEEFHSLFAVATLQAVRAKSGGSVDEAMFHASGGGALTSELLRHAERGRRADFDSAHMFLARYQAGAQGRPTSRPHPVPDPVPEPQPPSDVAPIVDAPVVAKAPEAALPDINNAPQKAENKEVFVSSIGYLKRRGDGLAEAAATMGEGNANALVEKCVDTVEHLVDLFSQDESGCDAVDEFLDELGEASDMMVLMQVEDGDGPAADAVTLLLQLRKDMEQTLAA